MGGGSELGSVSGSFGSSFGRGLNSSLKSLEDSLIHGGLESDINTGLKGLEDSLIHGGLESDINYSLKALEDSLIHGGVDNAPKAPPAPTAEEIALKEKRTRQEGNFGRRSLLTGSEKGLGSTKALINSLLT